MSKILFYSIQSLIIAQCTIPLNTKIEKILLFDQNLKYIYLYIDCETF